MMSANHSEDRRAAAARKLRLAVCLQLHDANVCNHVRALIRHPRVAEVRIVRSAPVAALQDPRIRFEIVPAFPKWRRFLALYRRCRRLVLDGAVDAMLSFNPVPYGLIAAAAARGHVPYHLGFVGTDLYGWRQAAVWKPLRPVLRRAGLVTVTGARMRQECLALGARPESLVILPHTIDLDRFHPGDPAAAAYDFIFVGNLIPLKRVDLILQALAAVRARHATARLCIVGDGPARPALQALAGSLGIAHAVDFAGYVADAAPYLRQSRVLVLASESEGMPFAIIEGICCGLVPVSTRVGTIDEVIVDGEDGFLVPTGNPQALAAALARLMDDSALYLSMRARALEHRPACGDERATAAWDPWLARLAGSSLA